MAGEGLRESTFLVLVALAGSPLHGYALLNEIETLSGGRLRQRTSSLYASLERLLKDGLIADAGSEIVDGRLRRLFALTADGRALLGAESQRMLVAASEATRRLARQEAGSTSAPGT
jgi:DNA-binding PadR family transcriptional regulator